VLPVHLGGGQPEQHNEGLAKKKKKERKKWPKNHFLGWYILVSYNRI
jgi:cobyrinic acid a,c-diamide synthase